MSQATNLLLAAVPYQTGATDKLDSTLRAVTSRLRTNGYRILGAINHEPANSDCTPCEVMLENVETRELTSISQDRGPEARGCSLDPAALEAVVGKTLAGLENGADFLIVNRFGKQEAGGHGFRAAIEYAVTHGVPCLVGVGPKHLNDWQNFAGSFSQQLPCCADHIWDWCERAKSTTT